MTLSAEVVAVVPGAQVGWGVNRGAFTGCVCDFPAAFALKPVAQGREQVLALVVLGLGWVGHSVESAGGAAPKGWVQLACAWLAGVIGAVGLAVPE